MSRIFVLRVVKALFAVVLYIIKLGYFCDGAALYGRFFNAGK